MIVYRLFCRETGKAYIGATRRTLNSRMHQHRTRAARTTPETDNRTGVGRDRSAYPLYVDARKYGWDAFDIQVLNHARSFDELQAMEKAAILLYRTLVPTGYNQILEDKDKLRWMPLASGWNKGIPQSAAARAKMSASKMGASNYRARAFDYNGIVYPTMQECVAATGLTRNQLYRKLKSGAAKYLTPGRPGDYGAPHYKHTEEAKQRMSAYRLQHSARRRAILLDGQRYPSIISAVGVSGYSRDQIKKKLKRGEATYLTSALQ